LDVKFVMSRFSSHIKVYRKEVGEVFYLGYTLPDSKLNIQSFKG
jgi:hypothetical protein